MIWPFKRKPRMTLAEFAAQFPPAPCGHQETHYEWTKLEGVSCPACLAQADHRVKDIEMDRLADKIADRLKPFLHHH